MKLTIKKCHLTGASRFSPERCPAARALNDLGWENGRWEVGATRALFYPMGSVRTVFILSKPLTKAIIAYDQGKPFKTGTYVLKKATNEN